MKRFTLAKHLKLQTASGGAWKKPLSSVLGRRMIGFEIQFTVSIDFQYLMAFHRLSARYDITVLKQKSPILFTGRVGRKSLKKRCFFQISFKIEGFVGFNALGTREVSNLSRVFYKPYVLAQAGEAQWARIVSYLGYTVGPWGIAGDFKDNFCCYVGLTVC